MHKVLLLLTIWMLLSPSVVPAEGEKSAKEGFKQIHHGMKKITRAVDRNAKRGFKTVHRQAKKDVRTVDKTAKKTWKKAGRDVHQAVND